MKVNLKEGFFTGVPKDTSNKARKCASASVGAPILRNMDRSFFLGALVLEEFLCGL